MLSVWCEDFFNFLLPDVVVEKSAQIGISIDEAFEVFDIDSSECFVAII